MRRVADSLHKRESGGQKVEIRDHTTSLPPPPAEGCAGERSSVKNHLTARVYGLLILEWRSRTPWTGLTCWIGDYGVCVGKGTYFGTAVAKLEPAVWTLAWVEGTGLTNNDAERVLRSPQRGHSRPDFQTFWDFLRWGTKTVATPGICAIIRFVPLERVAWGFNGYLESANKNSLLRQVPTAIRLSIESLHNKGELVMNYRATRILAALVGVLIVFGGSTSNASIVTKMNVTYTDGSIVSGPLSFGLYALPVEVNATFLLGPGTPDLGGNIMYDINDVVSASVPFGDGLWTNLASFDMEIEGGVVESLDYQFSAIDTLTAEGPVILNFPLSITGTDAASGEAFSYTYANSTETITAVPEPASIIVWSLLGCVGITIGWRRRNKAG